MDLPVWVHANKVHYIQYLLLRTYGYEDLFHTLRGKFAFTEYSSEEK